MSKRNDGKGYRAPQRVADDAPRGLLGSFLQPRPAVASPMPKGWSSYVRGLAASLASPVLIALVPLVVLIEWLVALALGSQGPATVLAGAFQWPGPGTAVDFSVIQLQVIDPGPIGLLSIFVFVAIRAILLALVTTIVIERLRTGTSSGWAWRRAPRVFVVTLTVCMIGLALFFITGIVGNFLPQLGFLVLVGGMAGTVYLTAYAPAIAADEDRRMPATMQRGIRTSRMPSSGTLMVAVIYTMAMLAIDLAYVPSAGLDVTPSIGQWAGIIAVGYLNVGVIGMFAYRYLSVAPFVPEPEPPPSRRGR